jgi:hypothetical protein
MSDQFEAFAARSLAPARPIETTIEVGVAAGDVWAAISEAGNLVNVHPFCASNEVESWPGPRSRDHVRYYSGIHYQRDVLDWREGVGYDLAVGPPSGKIAVARWSIDPSGPDACRFTLEVTPFVRLDVSAEARARYEEAVIDRSIPPYVDAVARGVGHFAETGTPVARNQLGAHDLYSPAPA